MKSNLAAIAFIFASLVVAPAFAIPTSIDFTPRQMADTALPDLSPFEGQPLFRSSVTVASICGVGTLMVDFGAMSKHMGR